MTTPLLALFPGAFLVGWWAHARLHAHRTENSIWNENTARAFAEAADNLYDELERTQAGWWQQHAEMWQDRCDRWRQVAVHARQRAAP